MKKILYIATIISIVTYSFWSYFPKGFFYYGNALFIFLLCTYLYFSDKKSNIKFLLFCLSLNNFIDELFFDNTKFQINELIFIIIITFIYYARKIQIPKR